MAPCQVDHAGGVAVLHVGAVFARAIGLGREQVGADARRVCEMFIVRPLATSPQRN